MSLPTQSLRDLAFSTCTIAVVDELAGLDALLPGLPDALERHAALIERLPPLLDLRGRALAHARQYQRFLALAEADTSALEDRVHTANALAILAHAGEIAERIRAFMARLPHEQQRQCDAGSDAKRDEGRAVAIADDDRAGDRGAQCAADALCGPDGALRDVEVAGANGEIGDDQRKERAED
eukprot:gene5831-7443_t